MQTPQDRPLWHSQDTHTVLKHLETTKKGLSDQERESRQKTYGKNELPQAKSDTWYQLVLQQFASPLVYILLIVTIITFVLGEYIDGGIITIVLLFNAIIGAYQEGKAQNAILALQSYDHSSALVRRNGNETLVAASDVVPGDIIIVLEGNRVPADARVLEVEDASIDEAVLTGESKTKSKTAAAIDDPNAVPGDRANMIFKGTYVSRGKVEAVVVGIGTDTEIGRISSQTALYETEIPLQRKIKSLTTRLVLGIGLALIAIVGIAFAQGYAIKDIFLTTASLLVAVMPEGLPIVVTLVLAQGVQRMAKNNVLVKRLQAVEALGNADVIAVDKTGTLTRNELSVTSVILPSGEFGVSGVGYQPMGDITPVGSVNQTDLEQFAHLSALSANAEIFYDKDTTTIAGDPTEAAMLVFGKRAGFEKHALLKSEPLLDEIAFSYERKFYASLHQGTSSNVVIVTGAPEVVIKNADFLYESGNSADFTEDTQQALLRRVHQESAKGHRVIALASLDTKQTSLETSDIAQLVFRGLFVMEDQIRPEVRQAVERARNTNIRVVMITGDYPSTAQSIASDAGIYTDGDRVLSGAEIEQLNDHDLAQALPAVSVFARVTPEHKLRIIRAFRAAGETVAMTGDGVNDVPSLVAADLGVAMGQVGTEAAKEASDLVLLDDDFGNISKAVEEGKRIFANVKKVVLYLLSTNIGEVLVIACNIVIGATIPLNPAQIIWTNLLTDSFLVFPLTTEIPQKSSSKKRQQSLISRADAMRMAVTSLAMMASYLAIRPLYVDGDFVRYSTITLTVVVFGQVWIALVYRNRKSFRQILANHWFWLAVAGVILLQLATIYTPVLQNLLRTGPLNWGDWALALLASLIVPLADWIFTRVYSWVAKTK